MALEKDDMIDFKGLETELTNAVAKDEKYQRENDAKFRAIHQKVATYDEFRGIVLASHLKPLDKKDKTGGVSYQVWNKMTANTKSGQKDTNHDNTQKTNFLGTVPKTSADFDKMWKHACKTTEDKYNFLLNIGVEKLAEVMKTDCPLGEIVAAMKAEACYPKDLDIVLGILDIISQMKRFSLTLDFLDDDEKLDLNNVLCACKGSLDSNGTDNAALAQKYIRVYEKYTSKKF